jgi:hypothetical protein
LATQAALAYLEAVNPGCFALENTLLLTGLAIAFHTTGNTKLLRLDQQKRNSNYMI